MISVLLDQFVWNSCHWTITVPCITSRLYEIHNYCKFRTSRLSENILNCVNTFYLYFSYYRLIWEVLC